jgi:MerR family mercuric resistance operon transcriptional regulator
MRPSFVLLLVWLDFSLNSVLWYGIKGDLTVDSELTIGRVAKLADVNVETVRYYQRRGLLAEPDKPLKGHRRYSIEIVKRLRFIKRAQVLGFTLEEVVGLLGFEDARACAETRALAARKLDLIEQKLRDLTAMRKALANLVQQCDAGESAKGCPIIHVLSHD